VICWREDWRSFVACISQDIFMPTGRPWWCEGAMHPRLVRVVVEMRNETRSHRRRWVWIWGKLGLTLPPADKSLWPRWHNISRLSPIGLEMALVCWGIGEFTDNWPRHADEAGGDEIMIKRWDDPNDDTRYGKKIQGSLTVRALVYFMRAMRQRDEPNAASVGLRHIRGSPRTSGRLHPGSNLLRTA
jgi:hypothetical protein